MDDLIRRADAIERIANDNVVGGMERINEYNNSTEFNEYLGGISDAITTIFCDVPSVDTEWIPCSERLPNINGIYIVTRRRSDGFECRNLTDACYFDGTSTWHDDTRVNHGRKYLADVLAWMPLPKPYKGGDDE